MVTQPTQLNLIFHGPWGFVLDPTHQQIVAVTPDCSCHTFLMGDTPVMANMPAGNYQLTGASISGDSTNGVVQQTQLSNSLSVMPNWPANARIFTLPLTNLFPGIAFSRVTNSAGTGDNLIAGPDWNKLNSSSTPPVYLAANNILPYAIANAAQISLGGAAFWAPAPNFNLGRPSVNLHLFAQSLSKGTDASWHFADMAKALFNLNLQAGPGVQSVTSQQATAPGPLPKGVYQTDDLGDLGQSLQSAASLKSADKPMIVPYPFLCGGQIVATLS